MIASNKPPRSTPWGRPQSQKKLADGIVSYTTAGHGGIAVREDLNVQIHDEWRHTARKGWAWYEEDCEWSRVALAFPEVFSAHLDQAHSTARNYWPDAYTAATGRPVTLEESTVLRERKARAELADRWIAICAFGDWCKGDGGRGPVPPGHVGVIAHRGRDIAAGGGFYVGKEEARFLVLSETYAAPERRSPIGFVVPEHAEEWA